MGQTVAPPLASLQVSHLDCHVCVFEFSSVRLHGGSGGTFPADANPSQQGLARASSPIAGKALSTTASPHATMLASGSRRALPIRGAPPAERTDRSLS